MLLHKCTTPKRLDSSSPLKLSPTFLSQARPEVSCLIGPFDAIEEYLKRGGFVQPLGSEVGELHKKPYNPSLRSPVSDGGSRHELLRVNHGHGRIWKLSTFRECLRMYQLYFAHAAGMLAHKLPLSMHLSTLWTWCMNKTPNEG